MFFPAAGKFSVLLGVLTSGLMAMKIAALILGAVEKICDIATEIKETDRQAYRLLERVAAIEPLLAVKLRTNLSSPESLDSLFATVQNIHEFLAEYAGARKIGRALKRKSNADRFTQLGVDLTERIQTLQLAVAVDTWRKRG